MAKISDTYINALLADATYALDKDVTDGVSGSSLVTEELEIRMTPTLASYISNNFTMKSILFLVIPFHGDGFYLGQW